MTAMPRYRTDQSPRALATRLRALRTARVPVACHVYAGLSAPVPTSALHARITHAMARAFVAGTSADVPRFEPPPSAQLRLLTAASWGRLDGAGPDMTTFPVDLASELWWRVHERALGSVRALGSSRSSDREVGSSRTPERALGSSRAPGGGLGSSRMPGRGLGSSRSPEHAVGSSRTPERGSGSSGGPDRALGSWHAPETGPGSSRVQEGGPGLLRMPERRLACDLLLRLGYPHRAAEVIGLSVIDPRKHVLSPDLALEQLAVLRCHLPSSAVEAMALRGARSGLPPETRRDLALLVVFRNAARGADSTSMQAAAALATKASSELPQNGFTGLLNRARLHRALAAVPFVRRDIVETHRLLGRALESLTSITPVAEMDRLAWADEAYALYAFLVRTHLTVGLGQRAAGYADELAELSPGDDRTWALQGDALAACGQLDAALDAYGRGIALGGWGAARAAYLRAFVLERLGRVAEAAEDYVLSQRIDPTSSVVAGTVERALPGARYAVG
ncbi:BTAD domain-containing putative transcriptional regulator [Lentzea californiensis]|uniref:BTAD domain-containing putative transcriptional regulator n=1 Tax=Lentzea californiensis TaxID=438851 RepID=UPI002164C5DA|nr:BTAD domain-containing putative transcriptional regulator [Lentzea californiensis]MCR3748884.1 TPR repeat-containing protein [Lentzea californiensis]